MTQATAPDQEEVLKAIYQAAEKVGNSLSNHAFLTYREENGRRIMEILSTPGTPAPLALATETDGTITATRNGKPTHTMVKTSKKEMEALAADAVAELIAEETLRALSQGPISPDTLTTPQTRDHLGHAARRLISDTQTRNSVPAWLDSPRSGAYADDPHYIAEKLLTKHENWLLLETITPSHQGHTVLQYNLIARNSDIFRQMETVKESPPLHFYCNRMAPSEPEPRTFTHPGEVIATVRDRLGLPTNLWRVFTRIPHEAWPENTNITRDTIAKVCTVLAAANPTTKDHDSMTVIIPLLARQEIEEQAAWTHGDPVQAWANLTREYLSLNIPRHPFRSSETDAELTRIADTLRNTIRDNHPWGGGNWETLSRRSARWHRDVIERRLQDDKTRRNALAQQTWESAVQELTMGPFTFTPVTTGIQLVELGEIMNNCLGSYVHDCAQGHNRIFTVQKDGELAAAVELYLQDGRWTPGQAEAHNHAKPPKGVRHHLDQLSKLYQEKQETATE